MTPNTKRRAAPRFHQVMLYGLAAVLTILLLWLWSFLLRDIGDIARPDQQEVYRQHVDQTLVEKRDNLTKQQNDLQGTITDLGENQKLLRDSTNNARETMNQLLENQRRLADKNIQLSAPEQEAIAESQKLFLENQKQYQDLNAQIVQRTNEQRAIKQQIDVVEDQLRPMNEKADKAYAALYEQSRIKAAVGKLAVLLPLVLLALWLAFRYRKTTYGVLVYPFAVSVLLKLSDVVHEYFPSRYFKYIALLVLIIAIVWLISYLVRMIARPKLDFLLKQFREAYRKRQCPTCAFPIERGPLKGMPVANRRQITLVTLPAGGVAEKEEPYSCPSCGERLFEECPACHAVRHSLLPHCAVCGAARAEQIE